MLSSKGNTDGVEHEGWSAQDFLNARVRALFETLLDIDEGIVKLESFDKKKNQKNAYVASLNSIQIKQFLFKEIATELETIHADRIAALIRSTFIIMWLHKPLSNKLNEKAPRKIFVIRMLAILSKKICGLEEGEEYSFAGGSSRHAIYINFQIKNGLVVMRIDNRGQGISDQSGASYLSRHEMMKKPENKWEKLPKQTYVYPVTFEGVTKEEFSQNKQYETLYMEFSLCGHKRRKHNR